MIKVGPGPQLSFGIDAGRHRGALLELHDWNLNRVRLDRALKVKAVKVTPDVK